jgi:hypothetical protein
MRQKSFGLKPPTSNLKRKNSMTREDDLKKQGWEKRFTIDEPRLSEMVEQYKELGFEVLLESVDPSSEECTTCITSSPNRYRTIYTRKIA